MSKFPQLLILLAIAGQARADLCLSGFGNDAIRRCHPANSSVPGAFMRIGHRVSNANSPVSTVPEPGVFVALISGAAMLLARRRR